jgi:hypothetical protein
MDQEGSGEPAEMPMDVLDETERVERHERA